MWIDPWGWNGIPQLPPSIIYEDANIIVKHYYGNTNPLPGVPAEHSPIHFHAAFKNEPKRNYRFHPYGEQLKKDKTAAPKKIKDKVREIKNILV